MPNGIRQPSLTPPVFVPMHNIGWTHAEGDADVRGSGGGSSRCLVCGVRAGSRGWHRAASERSGAVRVVAWRLAEHPPCQARIYPDMFSLAQAHQGLDESGQIASPQLAEFFETTIAGFLDLAEANKHYPCMKTAWIEYLGERLEPETTRIDS